MLELKDVQREIGAKGERLCALLYANSQPRVAGYMALAHAIDARGHLCILVHPRSIQPSPEELEKYGGVKRAAIGSWLPRIEGVDVFISSEVIFDTSPPGAATVMLHHSLPEFMKANYAGSLGLSPTIVREADYFLIALKQSAAAWTAENYAPFVQIYPPEFLSTRRPVLDIVPAGYPKIDFLEAVIDDAQPLDTILFSPTRTTHQDGLLRKAGAEIIRALLKRFPEFRVVLRPYPFPEDIELGRSIAGEFAEVGCFTLDESMTGLEHQKRAALVVTDRSSSAVSFSLATGRPTVFISLEGAPTPYDLHMDFFGFRACGLPAAMDAVECCLGTRDYWREHIRVGRAQRLYNPGKASDYVADQLPIFAARESRPDWLSVPRTPWHPSANEEETALHLQKMRDRSRGSPSATQAIAEIRAYVDAKLGESTPVA